jgi:hypothetical protein
LLARKFLGRNRGSSDGHLLVLAEVAHHLAAAAHLEVADLVGHGADAEPVPVVRFLGPMS